MLTFRLIMLFRRLITEIIFSKARGGGLLPDTTGVPARIVSPSKGARKYKNPVSTFLYLLLSTFIGSGIDNCGRVLPSSAVMNCVISIGDTRTGTGGTDVAARSGEGSLSACIWFIEVFNLRMAHWCQKKVRSGGFPSGMRPERIPPLFIKL